MNIDEDSGVITTAVSNAFDYERQTEMIVQVLARDTLVDEYGTRHTTYAQLTILVLDVNDETPRITVVCITQFCKSCFFCLIILLFFLILVASILLHSRFFTQFCLIYYLLCLYA